MLSTRFTTLVGCTAPVQRASVATGAPLELVAAVSKAGGLGMIGAALTGLSSRTLAERLDRAHALTERPFGDPGACAPSPDSPGSRSIWTAPRFSKAATARPLQIRDLTSPAGRILVGMISHAYRGSTRVIDLYSLSLEQSPFFRTISISIARPASSC